MLILASKQSTKSLLLHVTITAILFLSTIAASAQVSIDLEGNYIFSIPYNKVRIPAAGGTMIDIANDLDPEQTFTFRARVNFAFKERHIISALYAPLTIQSSGRFNQPINYSDETFPAGAEIAASYKFNSYRLTYRYLITNREKVKFGLGLTGKIREANITLSSNGNSADFPDLGFVPLINFYFSYHPIDELSLLLEGDALGSRQGRAEDLFAGVTYQLSEKVTGKIGYRLLEGGADVERNYNFAWINYLAAGVIVRFK
jgi:opacity protein-like surface antigen